MSFLTPGEKLKEIRKALKIRQSEFEKAGVSRNFISMVENNKRKLSSKVALKIFNTINAKKELLNIDMEIDYEYLKLSSKKAAEKYCNENLNTNSPSETINEIIEISKQYELTTSLFKAYLLNGDILYNKGNFKHSCSYYYEALELCSKISENNEKAHIYNKIGKCRYRELNYIEALSLFNKAHELSIKINDNKTKNISQFNIALTNKKLGKLKEAIISIGLYLDECDSKNEFENYALGVILKANCYIEDNQSEKSINLYSDLINSQEPEDTPTLAIIYNNMGLIYTSNNNLDLAIKYFDKAIDIRSKLNNNCLSHSLIDKASALLSNGMYSQAIKCANDGIALASKDNDLEYLLNGYHILEEIYKKLESTENLERIYKDVIHLFVQNF